jgi:DNA polymerase-4
MKKIIHIDMDAFFAAIEIREQPWLKGKCIVVGGPPNSRGVVSTCSYEARKFGVHSGMSSYQAWNICPEAIFLHPHFELYINVSQQIRKIFYQWTDLVEPMSLDEAYLDVTENKQGEEDAVKIAQAIKAEVLQITHLTCSAGVSYNKFLAKIGSDLQKPDGLTYIPPEKAQDILFTLPIEKYHGIGKVTAAKLRKKGIKNGADLYQWELQDLIKLLGKTGVFYYYVVRGIDKREVITEVEPKTLSCETTFSSDIDNLNDLLHTLNQLAEHLSERLKKKGIKGNTLTLKIKYDNFQLITRSCTLPCYVDDTKNLCQYSEQLLIANWDSFRKVRLLGLGISKLEDINKTEQLLIPL